MISTSSIHVTSLNAWLGWAGPHGPGVAGFSMIKIWTLSCMWTRPKLTLRRKCMWTLGMTGIFAGRVTFVEPVLTVALAAMIGAGKLAMMRTSGTPTTATFGGVQIFAIK